jgi:hypothetical protein
MFIWIKLSKVIGSQDKNPYKNETPGPLHRIDDELKAPGSFASKS